MCRAWPRGSRGNVNVGLCVLMLLAVFASCRDKPIGPATRNITTQAAPSTTTPASVVAAHPAAVLAGEPDDNLGQEIEANPFAGCDGCHVDCSDELVLSVHHTEEKIRCEKCHGKSDGHISDENNEVKPDRLFTRKTLDKFCGECHECDRPAETKPAKAPPEGQRTVCTDCHHPHSLALTLEAKE